MRKSYYVDTCALLEGNDTIEVLRNGEENNIKISITTINELDGLLKSPQKRYKALGVVKSLLDNKDSIEFIGDKNKLVNNDDIILNDTVKHITDLENSEIVTNDLIFQLKAHINGVKAREYKKSNPYDDTNPYTGFIEEPTEDNLVNNCFYFKDGFLNFYHWGESRLINYENEVWGVKPKDVYQNAALELLKNKDIHITTIQSKAGTGKSYLSLATGIKEVFQLRKYKRLIIIKPPGNIGEELGFLPGDIYQKMDYHWRPLYKLLIKLHENRAFNKGWLDPNDVILTPNPKFIEFLPMNFLRGENIDDAFVIVSEGQNIPRNDMRTVLTRMGDNVKLVVEGDVMQIDNISCSQYNNGLNWITKLFKGDPRYAHLTMNCKKTRGPICDMANRYKL